jgi:hypothetical protein
MTTDEEREAQERLISEKLEKSINKRPKDQKELMSAKKEEMLKELMECEPLGELRMSPNDMLGLLAFLQANIPPNDYDKFILVFSLMYGIEDENEFLKRLAKTAMLLPNIQAIEVNAGEDENP